MAENTTQIEGVKISGLLEKTTLTGAEMFVMADSGSNKKVAASTLKAYIGIEQEKTTRQEADAQLSNLIQDVDEQSQYAVNAIIFNTDNSDISVLDAGDPFIQQTLDGYEWDTIAHYLNGLAAEDMIDMGTIPLLIARDHRDRITECAIFKLPLAEASTAALHTLANYAPLSLASLYEMKQPKLTNSTDILVGNAKLTLTEEAKHTVFDDLWKAAGCTIGTGESKYICNGIGHTYAEAKYLYDLGHPGHGKLMSFYRGSTIKTNLPERMNGNVEEGSFTYMGCKSLTKVVAPLFIPGNGAFRDCTALQSITCYSLAPERNAFADIYLNCSALTTIDFQTLWARDVDLSSSPLLDIATFQRFVSKYDGSKAITIYVHPTVYAKLTDTSNTQWYAVMTQAVNKKIAFATKE